MNKDKRAWYNVALSLALFLAIGYSYCKFNKATIFMIIMLLLVDFRLSTNISIYSVFTLVSKHLELTTVRDETKESVLLKMSTSSNYWPSPAVEELLTYKPINTPSTTKLSLVPNTVSQAAKSGTNYNSHEIFRCNMQNWRYWAVFSYRAVYF